MSNKAFLSKLDLITSATLKDGDPNSFADTLNKVRIFSNSDQAAAFIKDDGSIGPDDAHVMDVNGSPQKKFHFRLYRLSKPLDIYSPEGMPLDFVSSLDSNTIIPIGYGARKYFYFENGDYSAKKKKIIQQQNQTKNLINSGANGKGGAGAGGNGPAGCLAQLMSMLQNLLSQLFSGQGPGGGEGCLSKLIKFLLALLLLALLILLLMNLKECSKYTFQDALKTKKLSEEVTDLEKKKQQLADQLKEQDEQERRQALERNNQRIREQRKTKVAGTPKDAKKPAENAAAGSGTGEAGGSGNAGVGDDQDKFLKTIAFYGQSVNAETLSRSSVKWDDMTDEDFDKATPKFRKRVEEFCDEQLKEGNDCYRDQIRRIEGNRLYKTFGKKIKSIRQGKEEE